MKTPFSITYHWLFLIDFSNVGPLISLSHIPAPLIFAVAAVFSAYRDVRGEHLMKSLGNYDPLYILFVGTFATVLCSILLAFPRWKTFFKIPKSPGIYSNILMTNLFTFLSFICYFKAIDSPVGAGINSVMAFGVDPLFTAVVAKLIRKEMFGKKFFVCGGLSIIGILLIGLKPLSQSTSELWGVGLILCLTSSVLYALYVIYLKRLSEQGLSANQLVFYRFVVAAIFGIFYCLSNPAVVKPISVQFGLYTFFGYTLSVMLFVHCVSRLSVERIIILGFLIPIFTFVLSCFVNHSAYEWWEFLGVVLILSIVLIFEWKNLRGIRWRLF